jgi:hypothetical protein
VKTKLRGRVQVVYDGNDEVTVGYNVFQLVELVDPYRVVTFTNLEENLNFHIAQNTFVDVDVEELNDILRTSVYTEVKKKDDDIEEQQLNIRGYDGYDDDEIEEEEEEEEDSD